MTIKAKLILSFTLMIVVLLISGITSIIQFNSINNSQKIIADDRIPKIIAVEKIIIRETRIQMSIREYAVETNPVKRKAILAEINENRQDNHKLRTYLEQSIRSDKGKVLYASFTAANNALVKTNNEIMSLLDQGENDAAAKVLLSPEAHDKRIHQRVTLQNLVDYQKHLSDQSVQKGKDIARDTKTLIYTLLILSLILGVGATWFILRSVVRPLHGMKQVMQEIVRTGNFKRQINVTSKDEIGDTLKEFNILLSDVEKSIDEIGKVVGALSEGDFSVRMTGSYVGSLDLVKQGVNKSADSVAITMKELGSLIRAMSEGRFNATFDADVHGEFRKIADDALNSIGTLNLIISEINAVMNKMQQGQFQHRVGIDAQGALQDLKNGINYSMDELEGAIKDITRVIVAQSEGDLTQTVSSEYHGDLKTVTDALNHTSQKLSDIVSQAVQSADVVNNAALEVSQGSMDLSQRVQEQAAALEETSATMDEMNSAVQANTENALNATKESSEVQLKANEGSQVMGKTIEAMKAIEESSHKISEIVTLIDSIAFQTNLLALNAAVEAARAGDHGRGFAVVAGEVRSLAQKSAEAAKDIKSLIDETSQRVEQGASLATKSGDMLSDINSSIDNITQMISHIAQASSEQANGVSQVHIAISQIDQVTQQNAALVEETSAAAESMSEQAQSLSRDMSFFKTGNLIEDKHESMKVLDVRQD
jgi:Methyl-accepting chemotaxis protein